MAFNPRDILGKRPTPIEVEKPLDFDDVQLNDYGNDSWECDEGDTAFLTPWPEPLAPHLSTKYLMAELKRTLPMEYTRFFPRIYHEVKAFRDWRKPNVMAVLSIARMHNNHEYIAKFQAPMNHAQYVTRWYRSGCPSFFISKEFLDAVMNTDLPKELDLSNLHLPFESFVFILPTEHDLKFDGRAIDYFSVTRATGGIKTDIGEIQSPEENDKLIITTSIGLNEFFAPGYNFQELSNIAQMDVETIAREAKMAPNLINTEGAFTLELFKTAIKLVLAMEALPDVVETSPTERRPSNTRNRPSHVWSPNVIGRHYRIERSNGDGNGGTHASPRMHMRRGHFRRTRIGVRFGDCVNCSKPRNTHYENTGFCQLPDVNCDAYVFDKTHREIRTDWIKPMWVNLVA